jgi:hypothetical protein
METFRQRRNIPGLLPRMLTLAVLCALLAGYGVLFRDPIDKALEHMIGDHVTLKELQPPRAMAQGQQATWHAKWVYGEPTFTIRWRFGDGAEPNVLELASQSQVSQVEVTHAKR